MLTIDSGDYHVVFEAVVYKRSGAVLRIDNVTLLNENCTYDKEIGWLTDSEFNNNV